MPLSSRCGGTEREFICALCGRTPNEECPRGEYEDTILIDRVELRRRLQDEFQRGYEEGQKA